MEEDLFINLYSEDSRHSEEYKKKVRRLIRNARNMYKGLNDLSNHAFFLCDIHSGIQGVIINVGNPNSDNILYRWIMRFNMPEIQ